MLELLPIIWMMFILLGAGLGSWGIVHTATLHSIAARNYAFFIFNNRSDLSYLKDYGPFSPKGEPVYYRKDASGGSKMTGKRFHFIGNPPRGSSDGASTIKRRPAFGKKLREYSADQNRLQPADRNNTTWWEAINPRNYSGSSGKRAAPVWIMVGYGICLDADCGD